MADNDWLSRNNLADINPSRRDTFSSAGKPTTPRNGSPGARPITYQKARNFNVTADVTPVPLTQGAFQCDTLVLNVLSTAANSVFFGFSSSINATTGLELQPGNPVSIGASNTREFWELQRLLETMAGIMLDERGYSPLGSYRAPRVCFNSSDYFVMATVPTVVRVMMFLVPEQQ